MVDLAYNTKLLTFLLLTVIEIYMLIIDCFDVVVLAHLLFVDFFFFFFGASFPLVICNVMRQNIYSLHLFWCRMYGTGVL